MWRSSMKYATIAEFTNDILERRKKVQILLYLKKLRRLILLVSHFW